MRRVLHPLIRFLSVGDDGYLPSPPLYRIFRFHSEYVGETVDVVETDYLYGMVVKTLHATSLQHLHHNCPLSFKLSNPFTYSASSYRTNSKSLA